MQLCICHKDALTVENLGGRTHLSPKSSLFLSGTDHGTKCRPQSKVQIMSLMGNQAVQCQAQQAGISKAKQVVVQKPGSRRYS